MSLEDALGYSFRDRALLETALTHPSYGEDHHVPHYQRMEFLGDAVLQLAMSRLLYDELPDMPEGRLTFVRARLVREETLAEAAREVGIGAAMRLSHGAETEGGRDKPSILCDMMEAVLAAVYLDGGFDEASRIVKNVLGKRIAQAARDDGLDAKSRLQMMLEKTRPGLRPEYALLSQTGPAHNAVFTMRVEAEGHALGEGSGKSKREAEQNAARAALARLMGES